MSTKRLIQQIQLQNFLSFGPDSAPVELLPLNVLIGANASGKTNFIEAFRLLNAAPTDLGHVLRQGGGIKQFLWKGQEQTPIAKIELVLSSALEGAADLGHTLSFTAGWNDFQVVEERIYPTARDTEVDGDFLYRTLGNQRAEIKQVTALAANSTASAPKLQTNEVQIRPDRSVLSELKDPSRMPFLHYFSELYSKMLFFTDVNYSRRGPVRNPQNTGAPNNRLWEDASNLGIILNNLLPDQLQQITDRLKLVYDSVNLIKTNIEGGYIQLYLFEKGLSSPIPAMRLSEGTLRYLCLLTLLLHPEPPPLICIEEPETGLHPHVLPYVAELLIEASKRTQLVVTTHSDALISGLTEVPESILVCERDLGGTSLRRLSPEQIRPWLDRYALGDLWRMGEIGGTP